MGWSDIGLSATWLRGRKADQPVGQLHSPVCFDGGHDRLGPAGVGAHTSRGARTLRVARIAVSAVAVAVLSLLGVHGLQSAGGARADGPWLADDTMTYTTYVTVTYTYTTETWTTETQTYTTTVWVTDYLHRDAAASRAPAAELGRRTSGQNDGPRSTVDIGGQAHAQPTGCDAEVVAHGVASDGTPVSVCDIPSR